MKLIHCADLHLGSNLTTNLTAEQAQKRNYELIENFERMIQHSRLCGLQQHVWSCFRDIQS